MNSEEIQKLNLICISLKEFCYGLDSLDKSSQNSDQGSPKMRFYMNSLYSYTANYFLLDNGINDPIGGNLYPALEEIDLQDNLDDIINILNTRIDALEFKEILRTFRNKVIVHYNYSFDAVDRYIYNVVNLRTEENILRYQFLLQTLYDKVKELYIRLSYILSECEH